MFESLLSRRRVVSNSIHFDSEAVFRHAFELHQRGDVDKAIELYRRYVKHAPNNVLAQGLLAEANARLGRFAASLDLLDAAIRLEPANAFCLNVRGSVLAQMNRLEDALRSFDAALQCDSANADVLCNKGNVFTELKRWEEALNCFDRAVALRPGFFAALTNRGVVLQRLNRDDDALRDYQEALRLNPGYADAHFNLACLMEKRGAWESALQAYDRAIEVAPGYYEAHSNRGALLYRLGRLSESMEAFGRALLINRESADGFFKLGHTLLAMRRYQEAAQCYDKAIALDAKDASGFIGKGNAYREMKEAGKALDAFEQAYRLDPGADYLRGNYLLQKLVVCDWRGWQAQVDEFIRAESGCAISPPLNAQVIVDLPAFHRVCAVEYARREYFWVGDGACLSPGEGARRLRIGYCSSDFGNHPVGHLVAGLIEQHDRERFEIVGISWMELSDPWRDRLVAAFDEYVSLGDAVLSNDTLVQRVRALNLDIAIDLNGHTLHARTGVFAERIAPIQASYIGFLGTMGAPYIDYLIADPVLVPEDMREFYQEKIVYLPWYQSNDDKTVVADRVFARAELGLPADAMVYASFNNNYKITPDVFDIWMRILKQVPGSVLWLFASNDIAAANLRKEARARGIDDARLIFAERMPLELHLARQKAADLFLDTFPYNAGATASNALRVGLPVLTRSGASFASRYGASLLTAVGMPELITNAADTYEALAVRLGNHPAELAALRAKLAANLPTAPLFDTAAFARNIEAAYVKMVERNRAGQAPDHIVV